MQSQISDMLSAGQFSETDEDELEAQLEVGNDASIAAGLSSLVCCFTSQCQLSA